MKAMLTYCNVEDILVRQVSVAPSRTAFAEEPHGLYVGHLLYTVNKLLC